MNLKNIYTSRLLLIPVTLEITKSLLDGNNKELEKLGIIADGQWPTEDTMDILPSIYITLEKDKLPSGFETWMIVKKDSMQVVGDIGFHGKPSEKGEVEVGFGLVEQARGVGYGFESLKAMIDWLQFQNSVKIIKAECLISNTPSAKILTKVGMREVKRNHDLIFWELVKPESK